MATSVQGVSAPAIRSPAYARYVLGLLFVVYVFNFIDRQILSILVEPIKRDLGLSDSTMGFLTGPAFAVFYTFAGIPIARLADRGVRRSIIAAGAALWSLLTALSGLPQAGWQLVLARIGVGVGEAACSPPAHSLLSDYFAPERRATALAVYASGIHFGTALGFLIGGWVSVVYGWRATFFIVGLPGLVAALLVRLTVSEPERGTSEGDVAAHRAPPSAGEVARFLWALPSFRHLSAASALTAFAGYAVAVWVPTFLARVHAMPRPEIGLWLAAITAVAGSSGAYLGGGLTDRLRARDPRYFAWVPAIAGALGVPFVAFLLFWQEPHEALLLSVPSTILGAMWLGPIFAVTQHLVRPHMRAVASAVLLFIINLIGLGLGPWSVGVLNDVFDPRFGAHAVRYSLALVVAVTSVWATLHFALAARTLRADLGAKDA